MLLVGVGMQWLVLEKYWGDPVRRYADNAYSLEHIGKPYLSLMLGRALAFGFKNAANIVVQHEFTCKPVTHNPSGYREIANIL